MKSLILKLFEIGAVKFGNFTLKSGIQSPIYIDLRIMISYPQLLVAVGDAMKLKTKDCKYDLICGVPYTALPIATAISIEYNIPMILRRKEKKEYGTGKTLEGIFQKGQRCLVLEDIITSGKSILETIEPLNAEGLVVEDIVVVVDREQGGRKTLVEKGYRVHSLFTITTFINTLLEEKKIDATVAESVHSFIRNNQVATVAP